jgi:hypothetical protein
MKASEIVTFVNDVIEQHGDINVNVQTDGRSGNSQVTGFWVRLIPETGERVLIVCHKAAQH